jgi:hypothetical protein
MTIVASEIDRFNRLGATWWNRAGPMRPLQVINELRRMRPGATAPIANSSGACRGRRRALGRQARQRKKRVRHPGHQEGVIKMDPKCFSQ